MSTSPFIAASLALLATLAGLGCSGTEDGSSTNSTDTETEDALLGSPSRAACVHGGLQVWQDTDANGNGSGHTLILCDSVSQHPAIPNLGKIHIEGGFAWETWNDQISSVERFAGVDGVKPTVYLLADAPQWQGVTWAWQPHGAFVLGPNHDSVDLRHVGRSETWAGQDYNDQITAIQFRDPTPYD